MKNKILALITALLLSLSSLGLFASCAVEEENGEDVTKANLYVATYNGGIGRAWLDDAVQRFQDLYADATHFQEGRKGVKIHVDADKDKYSGKELVNKTLNKDVYLTEGVEYYEYVNAGKVAQINDVVNGSLSAYGESETIKDKLDTTFSAYLTAKDGNYYMLPFYDGFYGFIYDIELFETKGFYFNKNGDFIRLQNESQRADFEAKKSSGPDGDYSTTYDNGLPATYEQFVKLFDQIRLKSCTPLCYAGGDQDYVDKAFRALIADYEGYDNLVINYTFSGTAVTLVKEIKADGTVVTEKLDINQDNAYELKRQPGNYYFLDMMEKLFTVDNVGGKWNQTSYSQAQKDFIGSKYGENVPYAMLTEGVWWENEAAQGTAFSDNELLYGETREDRRFGFLPMPKSDPSRIGEQQTLLSANSSYCFINKDCSNMELAKEFLRFLHTDAEMSKFTAKTGVTRSFSYDISAEDEKNASAFGKSIIALRKNAKVVYPYSSLELVINNSSAFTEERWFLTSIVNDQTRNRPSLAFQDGVADAKTYFNGLYNYHKNSWGSLIRK